MAASSGCSSSTIAMICCHSMNCFTLSPQAQLNAQVARSKQVVINKRWVSARGLKENVAALPSIDTIKAVTLQPINHIIPNAPGKKASVAIYGYLASKYGGKLTAEAAEEGLQLYDEVVADAKAHPGSHPNIDLLLNVVSSKTPLTIEVRAE